MPIPLGYSRHVLSGHLPNGEKFQTGFWVSQAPSDAAAATSDAQAVAGVLNGRWATLGSPTTIMSAGAGFDTITVYSYPSGGPDASFVGQANLTGAAGTASPQLIDQMAVCCTLNTGLSGRTHRGRMFIPCNAPGTLSSGQLGTSVVSNLATWMKDTFDAVNSATSPGFVVVLSQKLGTAQRVTSVTVDSRIDIQRRRSDRETIINKFTATL